MSKKRREFTPEFKLQCVLDLISGRSRPVEICREHNISDSLLARWRQQFTEQAPKIFEPDHKNRNHSDHGGQYIAKSNCEKLVSLDCQISMAAKGKPWENSYAESVIGHLKDELDE